MTDLSILNEQNVRILLGGLSDFEELVGGRLWRLADWWFHLKKHIGINSFNYFLF